MTEKMIFFSYSRDDSEFVLNLAKELRAAGANVWLDQLDIKPGTRWDKSIENALDASKTMLVILSNKSVASHNVMDEVSYALEEGKTVIPVLLEECDVPFRLRRLQFADFTKSHIEGVATLSKALGLDSKALKPTPIAHEEPVNAPVKPVEKVAPPPPPKKETVAKTPVTDSKKPKSKLPLYIIVGVVVVLGAMAIGGVFSSDKPYDKEVEAVEAVEAVEEATVEKPELDVDELRKELKLIAEGIQFESSRPDVKDSEEEIKRLSELLEKHPNVKISIACHTDSQGSERINMMLSQKRADFIKMLLVNKGVAANRITAKGYGETKPIGNNATSAGRAQNRRVEIGIIN
jgi:outer membrane protein OmpA-like peptidoglycan-associated protein